MPTVPSPHDIDSYWDCLNCGPGAGGIRVNPLLHLELMRVKHGYKVCAGFRV